MHCRFHLITRHRRSVTRCTRCHASELSITGTSLTPALRLQNLSNVTVCSRLHMQHMQCNEVMKVVVVYVWGGSSLIFIAIHRIWGLLQPRNPPFVSLHPVLPNSELSCYSIPLIPLLSWHSTAITAQKHSVRSTTLLLLEMQISQSTKLCCRSIPL